MPFYATSTRHLIIPVLDLLPFKMGSKVHSPKFTIRISAFTKFKPQRLTAKSTAHTVRPVRDSSRTVPINLKFQPSYVEILKLMSKVTVTQ